jgi:hypothetical protein
MIVPSPERGHADLELDLAAQALAGGDAVRRSFRLAHQ